MSQRRMRCGRGADVPTPYKRWAGMVTDMRGMVNSDGGVVVKQFGRGRTSS